jgi:preprotein translocase subunit SecE
MIKQIKEFTANVVSEMKKVSWPTKEQLQESTIVVIITSLIFTVFVFVIDRLMTLLVTALS